MAIVVLNRPVLDAYLRGPSGDVWRWLDKRGDRAVRGAKRDVGVQTGQLRASIHMKHTMIATGQELWIGSNTVKYARMHHEGTRPHVIAPKAGGALVIGRGRTMVRGPVLHPGTRPNPYLRNQLYHFRF